MDKVQLVNSHDVGDLLVSVSVGMVSSSTNSRQAAAAVIENANN